MMSGLPRVALWLLSARLTPEWRDFVIGDLEEEFRARAAASPPAARRWLWWQILRCLLTRPPTSDLPLRREISRSGR